MNYTGVKAMTIEVPVTALLRQWRAGDDAAFGELLPLVYAELRRLARGQLRGERRGHTLPPPRWSTRPTCGWLGQADVDWQDRAHFLAVAARLMRRILVDHARAPRAPRKRGGGVARVACSRTSRAARPDVDLLALDRRRSIELAAAGRARRRGWWSCASSAACRSRRRPRCSASPPPPCTDDWTRRPGLALRRALEGDSLDRDRGERPLAAREELFAAAVERPAAERGQAFLAARAAADRELRGEVEALLGARPRAGAFLEPRRTRRGSGGAAATADAHRWPPRWGPTGSCACWAAAAWARSTSARARRRRVPEAGGDQAAPPRHGRATRCWPASAPSGRSWPRLDHPDIAQLLDGGTTERRPALLRDGARRGRAASTATATRERLVRRRAPAALPAGVRGGAVRAPEPGRPPRPQAGQHPGDGRRHAQAARLRHRQAARSRELYAHGGDAHGSRRSGP